MHRRITLAVAIGALLTSSAAVAVGALSPSPALAQQSGGFNFSAPNVVASGLAIPWGLSFLPDGSALTVERATARVLRLRVGAAPEVVGTVPNVDPDGEGGALGLEVSPTFSQDGWVYVYHTSPSDNRIVRFQLNSVGSPQTVLTGIPRGTQIHNGGRIQFGPDGMLYAATGDAGTTANAQNMASLAGKILRMTPTGAAAPGNPTAGSLVYSRGHRNVQGLAWNPQGTLFASEFGAVSLDEVNRIQAGGNYGWPTCEGACNPTNPSLINPLVTWPTSQSSPSGAAIANGNMFVAALAGRRLWVIPQSGTGLGTPTSVLNTTFGRIRTVELGPDGWLWITTSNRDGRGQPVAADDRVVRFPPAGGNTSPPPVTTSPPPVTTSPPPVTTSPPPGGGGCSASYQIVNQWGGNFQANVTVTNNGATRSNGWNVRWSFLDGQVISQLWGGIDTQTGAQVTVDNETWNGAINPPVTFGFIASWNNQTNRPPATITCTLR